MKVKILMLLMLSTFLLGCNETPIDMSKPVEKQGYAMGQSIGGNLKQGGVNLPVEAIVAGIKEAMEGTPQLSDDEVNKVLIAYQKELIEAAQKENASFLENNKSKDGVVSLASGLQYKVLKSNPSGKSPKATDTVRVHYRGTLVNGEEFDSSYSRNQPAEFPLNGVIPGWTEGVQLMKEGEKWELYIPANLGYGSRGQGKIQPNSTLIFEIELLKVNP